MSYCMPANHHVNWTFSNVILRLQNTHAKAKHTGQALSMNKKKGNIPKNKT